MKKDSEQTGDHRQNRPAAIKGIIKVNSRGVGFFKAPGFAEDLEIETYFLKTALDGDEVLVAPLPQTKSGRRQGQVVKILRRRKTQFAGGLEKNGLDFFLKAADRRLYRDIVIPADTLGSAKLGDKVLVKIISWGDQKRNPVGRIIRVFGPRGQHEAEMQSIIFDKGFDSAFPPAVEKEAQRVAQLAEKNLVREIASRRDFRKVPTFTIDPEDAKDFDDAISLREITNHESQITNHKQIQNLKFKIPTYEVGVHIADVAYYVREGGLLDQEARKRGFTIYLVDRTVPMLPEILSNNLCSLNPQEDKLAFSAVFKLDQSGRLLDRWFGKTVIRSQKRFSYQEAQRVLNNRRGHFCKELNFLNKTAERLRAERFKKGAIDFDADEVKFELDQQGRPIKVFRKERLATNKLIEELMLLANREVAEFVFRRERQTGNFIFRVHDWPDPEKIKELSIFLRALGYDLRLDRQKTVSSKDLNALFAKIEGRAEESLIKTAAVRAMAKAVYSTKNIGHFGLAFQYYTHFTSPIRRYPDLLVHRTFDKGLGGRPLSADFAKLERLAAELSDQEVKVAEAERESIKYKQAEYMQGQIGQTLAGVISGVTEWGIYVEAVETRAEGMIKLREIGDDFYQLDKKQYALIGQRTKRKFRLGDKIKVRVKRADPDSRQIDYVLA